MDVSILAIGQEIALSGWLVDREDGLFIMADHYTVDYNHPLLIRVRNEGIMYPILAVVPVLVGAIIARLQGKSLRNFSRILTIYIIGSDHGDGG